MNTLQADLATLCEEWDVWTVVSTDEAKREAIIQRSDEDQASVTIVVSPNYPKGPISLTHVYGYSFKENNMSVSDALDEALAKWEEEHEGATGMGEPLPSGYGDVIDNALAGGMDEDVDPKQLAVSQAKVEKDVRDPKLNGLAGYYYDSTRKQFVVRVGVSLEKQLDVFRARALGLNRTKVLAVELVWPWQYMDQTDMPKVQNVIVCKSDALSSNNPNLGNDESVGSLRWYINNRVGNAMRKNHIIRERRMEGIVDEEGVYVEGLSNWKFDGDWEQFYENGNENILLGIHRTIQARVHGCTSVCLICDEKLPLDGMKTAICDKDLCRHGMENYGLGTDVVAEISQHQDVAELMVYMTCACVSNGKSRDTFTPMCPIMLDEEHLGPNYKGPLHFYVGSYGTGTKNFDLLTQTVQKIPPISECVALANGKSENLRVALHKRDPLIYPLLQWIFSSNRTHLEPLDPSRHFQGLGKYQFHLVSSSPEKETKFRNKRAIGASQKKGRDGRGSFWAWHGSQPGNWHCILRSGLKNYSNTKFMSAGAAYGAGIYTAKQISTSLGYMGSPYGPWKNAETMKHSSGMTIIALCELADDGTGYKDHGNGIVTIQDEDIICTRFLFAFPDGFKGDNGLHTDKMKFPDGVLEGH